jgi:MSHA biogenesis protein MshN
MSVINRVLKDLDQKGATPTTPAGVLAVQASPAVTRPRWPWLLPLLLVPAAAWWFWPAPGQQPPPEPVPEETQPQLRMSETLSPPSLPAVPIEEPALAQAEATAPAPPIAKAARPQAEPPLPVKLDTRLPEPGAAKVIKEVRPLSTGEQAEQAWRQATRLIELGRAQAGLEGLEAALRLDPGHGPARQTLIALSLEAGDSARGESLLREGQQLHPSDAWYPKGLAQLSLQRGDVNQAASTLKAGLGKNTDADYWSLYAGVLGKVGRHGEAAQAWREATRQNPGHGPWWIGLAVSLEQIGQRAEAAAAHQRALQTRLSPELRDFAARKAEELNRP